MGWEYRIFIPVGEGGAEPDIGLRGFSNSRTDIYYIVSRRVGLKMRSKRSLEHKTMVKESAILTGLSKWTKGFEPPEDVLLPDEMLEFTKGHEISCAKNRVQQHRAGVTIEQTDIVLTGNVHPSWPKRWRSWCCEGNEAAVAEYALSEPMAQLAADHRAIIAGFPEWIVYLSKPCEYNTCITTMNEAAPELELSTGMHEVQLPEQKPLVDCVGLTTVLQSRSVLDEYQEVGAAGEQSNGRGDASLEIHVCAYGILGASKAGKMIEERSEPPDDKTVFVDPAGPKNAGGASGAIYEYLGIHRDKFFPEPVYQSIKSVGDAKLHSYGHTHCIHVVGPNFRKGQHGNIESLSETQAAAVLSIAYTNVLLEFSQCDLHTLRLLPISGGIFAGRFAKIIDKLTAQAFHIAENALPSEVLRALSGRRIEMCIFDHNEFEGYASAIRSRSSCDALHT